MCWAEVANTGLKKIHAAPPSAMKGVKDADTQMLVEVLNLDTGRTRSDRHVAVDRRSWHSATRSSTTGPEILCILRLLHLQMIN